jgi:chromate transporter
MPKDIHAQSGRTEDPLGNSAVEVLRIFIKLGLTSFGGPLAHIGYFRDEFVTRRRWLDDTTYADLVALCQFLPGPASSQVGFSIGLMRAGYAGGFAAWTGFTLPSAILLVLFAYGAHALAGPSGIGLLHGLKLVAVAIVAQAVFGMARTMCPDRSRAAIGALATVVMLYRGSTATQIGVILFGGVVGLLLCRAPAPAARVAVRIGVSRRTGLASLTAFVVLLLGLPLSSILGAPHRVAIFDAFYRSGALVFGGGHVVLPLLRDAFVGPGWISDSTFLAGYGAAQAVPGPLFTFAAYLGAMVDPCLHGALGAVLGLIGIFLPGMLSLVGVLPFWSIVRARAGTQGAMRGINAAVVGLLGAALYSPVWTGSVNTMRDAAVALGCFVLLTIGHARPLFVVLISAASGIALTQLQ